jgi:hypothetical protein
MADDGANTREHPRFAVDAFVRVLPLGETGADKEYVFRVRDLSAGGLFLYTRVGHLYPFFVGTALQVALHDFNCAVEFRGVVARVVAHGSSEAERYPSGFGVRIIAIDDENKRRLQELLDKVRRGDPIY